MNFVTKNKNSSLKVLGDKILDFYALFVLM